MSSKIFKAIWITAVLVFLISLVFLMGVSYVYFSSIQKNQLKNETELAAQGVSKSGTGYFDGLNTEGYRVTWIDSEGNVLYDNEANSAKMENHLEREEVREALETGYGEAERLSGTLAENQYYAAVRLSDGTVLRLSIVQAAVWTLVLGFAQPICILFLIAMVLAFLIASRLTKRIVKPINEIDVNRPERYRGNKDFKEVEPLLQHIAEQKEQLIRDQEEIEKNALIRQEFTANASHELKTPLHVISGYAELLETGMVREEDIQPFAGKIRAESSRMTKLVEDIIDLTRLDNGGGELIWEDCDLYRITENAADSLEAVALAKNITIRVEGSVEGTNAHVKGVPQVLYSIVYNLCDNAVKYNRPGGKVILSVSQDSSNTILKVRDTGIGIPEESRERIFERFYRVDKSHSKDVGGTGLGLSIVKHAVMIHGGRIRVNSKVGEGTIFVVTLPRRQADRD